jgi:hypothetical protein
MFIMETSMLKTLITLVRGRTALIAEEVADQNALLILDQQMRDATGALDRAKKALAVAIAQENQEVQRLDATHSRIADLETRAVAAIEAGRDDLATEAAENIAALEGERDASLTARALFAAEIAKLKGHVLQQQMRSGSRAEAASRVPRFLRARSQKPRRRWPVCASIKSRQILPRRRSRRSVPRLARPPSPRSSRPRASVHA